MFRKCSDFMEKNNQSDVTNEAMGSDGGLKNGNMISDDYLVSDHTFDRIKDTCDGGYVNMMLSHHTYGYDGWRDAHPPVTMETHKIHRDKCVYNYTDMMLCKHTWCPRGRREDIEKENLHIVKEPISCRTTSKHCTNVNRNVSYKNIMLNRLKHVCRHSDNKEDVLTVNKHIVTQANSDCKYSYMDYYINMMLGEGNNVSHLTTGSSHGVDNHRSNDNTHEIKQSDMNKSTNNKYNGQEKDDHYIESHTKKRIEYLMSILNRHRWPRHYTTCRHVKHKVNSDRSSEYITRDLSHDGKRNYSTPLEHAQLIKPKSKDVCELQLPFRSVLYGICDLNQNESGMHANMYVQSTSDLKTGDLNIRQSAHIEIPSYEYVCDGSYSGYIRGMYTCDIGDGTLSLNDSQLSSIHNNTPTQRHDIQHYKTSQHSTRISYLKSILPHRLNVCDSIERFSNVDPTSATVVNSEKRHMSSRNHLRMIEMMYLCFPNDLERHGFKVLTETDTNNTMPEKGQLNRESVMGDIVDSISDVRATNEVLTNHQEHKVDEGYLTDQDHLANEAHLNEQGQNADQDLCFKGYTSCSIAGVMTMRLACFPLEFITLDSPDGLCAPFYKYVDAMLGPVHHMVRDDCRKNNAVRKRHQLSVYNYRHIMLHIRQSAPHEVYNNEGHREDGRQANKRPDGNENLDHSTHTSKQAKQPMCVNKYKDIMFHNTLYSHTEVNEGLTKEKGQRNKQQDQTKQDVILTKEIINNDTSPCGISKIMRRRSKCFQLDTAVQQVREYRYREIMLGNSSKFGENGKRDLTVSSPLSKSQNKRINNINVCVNTYTDMVTKLYMCETKDIKKETEVVLNKVFIQLHKDEKNICPHNYVEMMRNIYTSHISDAQTRQCRSAKKPLIDCFFDYHHTCINDYTCLMQTIFVSGEADASNNSIVKGSNTGHKSTIHLLIDYNNTCIYNYKHVLATTRLCHVHEQPLFVLGTSIHTKNHTLLLPYVNMCAVNEEQNSIENVCYITSWIYRYYEIMTFCKSSSTSSEHFANIWAIPVSSKECVYTYPVFLYNTFSCKKWDDVFQSMVTLKDEEHKNILLLNRCESVSNVCDLYCYMKLILSYQSYLQYGEMPVHEHYSEMIHSKLDTWQKILKGNHCVSEYIWLIYCKSFCLILDNGDDRDNIMTRASDKLTIVYDKTSCSNIMHYIAAYSRVSLSNVIHEEPVVQHERKHICQNNTTCNIQCYLYLLSIRCSAQNYDTWERHIHSTKASQISVSDMNDTQHGPYDTSTGVNDDTDNQSTNTNKMEDKDVHEEEYISTNNELSTDADRAQATVWNAENDTRKHGYETEMDVENKGQINEYVQTVQSPSVEKTITMEQIEMLMAEKDAKTEENYQKLQQRHLDEITTISETRDDQKSMINDLQMQILKLENKLLMNNVEEKEEVSSVITMENQVLRMENELLKMRGQFDDLQEKYDVLRAVREEEEKMKAEGGQYFSVEEGTTMVTAVSAQETRVSTLTDLLKKQTLLMSKVEYRMQRMERDNRHMKARIIEQSLLTMQVMRQLSELSEKMAEQQYYKDIYLSLAPGQTATPEATTTQHAQIESLPTERVDTFPSFETHLEYFHGPTMGTDAPGSRTVETNRVQSVDENANKLDNGMRHETSTAKTPNEEAITSEQKQDGVEHKFYRTSQNIITPDAVTLQTNQDGACTYMSEKSSQKPTIKAFLMKQSMRTIICTHQKRENNDFNVYTIDDSVLATQDLPDAQLYTETEHPLDEIHLPTESRNSIEEAHLPTESSNSIDEAHLPIESKDSTDEALLPTDTVHSIDDSQLPGDNENIHEDLNAGPSDGNDNNMRQVEEPGTPGSNIDEDEPTTTTEEGVADEINVYTQENSGGKDEATNDNNEFDNLDNKVENLTAQEIDEDKNGEADRRIVETDGEPEGEKDQMETEDDRKYPTKPELLNDDNAELDLSKLMSDNINEVKKVSKKSKTGNKKKQKEELRPWTALYQDDDHQGAKGTCNV